MPRIVRVLNINFLILSICVTVFSLIAFSPTLYLGTIQKNDSESTRQIRFVINDVLSHVFQAEPLYYEFYTDREKRHISDLRQLTLRYQQVHVLLIAVFLFFFLIGLSKENSRTYFIVFKKTLSLWIVVLFFVGIGTLLFFDNLFLLFHQIVFSNQDWLLDPKTEILIHAFPPRVFALIGVVTLTTILIILMILWRISLCFARQK